METIYILRNSLLSYYSSINAKGVGGYTYMNLLKKKKRKSFSSWRKKRVTLSQGRVYGQQVLLLSSASDPFDGKPVSPHSS